MSVEEEMQDFDAAFPQVHEDNNAVVRYYGLSVREYFAAKAMQGLLAKPFVYIAEDENAETSFAKLRSGLAKKAVQCADALIEELNK